MMFTVLKTTHLVTITITLSLFVLRCVWAFQNSPNLRHHIIRWLPHANDTVLFASALGTAATLGQYPFVDDWLTAKVIALLLYIGLGHITLWRCRTNLQRAVFMAASLAVFGYILLVARCHDPWACIG